MSTGLPDYFPERVFREPMVITPAASNPLLAGWTWVNEVITPANRALFVPVALREPITVRRIFTQIWANAGGSGDVGIYDTAGARVVSHGGEVIGEIQRAHIWQVADTALDATRYYLAVVLTSTSISLLGWDGWKGGSVMAGLRYADAAYPLPASVTLLDCDTVWAYVPCIGLDLKG